MSYLCYPAIIMRVYLPIYIWTLLDLGQRDCIHNVVQTGLRDRACPISYLCCTLLACEVGLVGTEENYSSCIQVRFLG
jgi:hypothetical protein